jgi:hypothetical protein
MQEKFNHRHSALRNVIERAFDVLKMKWRILLGIPHYDPLTKMITTLWSRYANNDDYGDMEVHAAYGVDTNWYQDSGATHHITGELNNLTLRDAYKGYDKVNTANGQGMSFSHVGHSVIRNPSKKIELCNVLHVPNTSKNLLSVHRFTYDNHVFIEFHPFLFLIKDQGTLRIIHRGRCVGVLYPLISSLSSSRSPKHAFFAAKPSQSSGTVV